MLLLQFMTLLLVLLPLLAAASNALRTEKPADVKKEPETVAGQLLKLACEQVEKDQQEKDVHGLSRKEMTVQEKDGHRHDRKWATEEKTKQGISKDGS